MASIGMAMQWATEKYEQDRVRREEANRYLAGSALFDSQLRMAEAQQFAEEQAQVESARTKELLNEYQGRIRRGDKQAYADYMNAILSTQGRQVVLDGNDLVELDQDGMPSRVIETIPENVSGDQLLSMANKYVATPEQVMRAYQQGQANELAYQQELNKMLLGNDFRMQQLDREGQWNLAGINARGQWDAAAAGARGNASNMQDLLSTYLKNDETIRGTANAYGARVVNPNFIPGTDVQGNFAFVDTTTGAQVIPTEEQMNTFNNATTEFLTEQATNPTVPPILTMTNMHNRNAARTAANLTASANLQAAMLPVGNEAYRGQPLFTTGTATQLNQQAVQEAQLEADLLSRMNAPANYQTYGRR